jgi:hypothetical protein
MPFNAKTVEKAFEAMLGELTSMLEGKELPPANEAAERFIAAAAPILEADDAPVAAASFLAAQFMETTLAAFQATVAVQELAKQGIQAKPVSFIPGLGVIMEAKRPGQPQAEAGLN